MCIYKSSKQARRPAVFLALCLMAAQALVTGSAPELPDPGHPRMTREQQEQLGLKAAAQVYKQMPVLPDSSPETKYLQELGKGLVRTIPPEHSWPYQFHVVAQKEINAFALPGGPIFVNVGTITASDNEAELAGVMAHEMSHVYMQHSAKQQEKASVLDTLAGLAGVVAETKGGMWGAMAENGIQFGAGSLMLKYSRGDEAQGGTPPQFLSDHPNPGNRRLAIEREIAEWPVREYRRDSPEFAVVHKEAASVHGYSAEEIASGAKSGRWSSENQKKWCELLGCSGRANQRCNSRNCRERPASVTDRRAAELEFSQCQPRVDKDRLPGELGCDRGAAFWFGNDRTEGGHIRGRRSLRGRASVGAGAGREYGPGTADRVDCA